MPFGIYADVKRLKDGWYPFCVCITGAHWLYRKIRAHRHGRAAYRCDHSPEQARPVTPLCTRPFAAPDEDCVIDLWHRCGLTRPWNNPHRDIARNMTTQADLFCVAELHGTIVATVMAGYDGHRGWVNYLAVGSCISTQRHCAYTHAPYRTRTACTWLSKNQPTGAYCQCIRIGIL
jgi:hypothetical protein